MASLTMLVHLTLALAITLLLLTSRAGAKSFIESCNSASQCSSMVGFRTSSSQKLLEIATLFNVDTVAVLGANNFDLATPDPENIVVGAHRVIKVPIYCSCVNGIWRGNSTTYKVLPGDTLSSIADVLFGKLVTFKQIAQANDISNPDQILAGSSLVIPFSCGCNNLFTGSNQPSILLSYVVESGDSVDNLVNTYGSVASDLMTLNSMNNASDLSPGDVVAVPIHACTSTFRRSAYDFGLVVANGSYSITAGHCVQCSCLANLQQVYCTPAPGSISGSCPDMRCLATNLTVGEMIASPSVQGCNVTSCLYTGFKKRIILSSLQTVNLNSCPAPPSPPSYSSATGSFTSAPGEAPVTLPGEQTPGTIPSTQSQSAFAPAPSASVRLTAHRQSWPATWILLGLLIISFC